MPPRRERQWVVLDTNVIVGFFTSRTRRSDNARVFDAWLVSRQLQLVVSPPLVSEYLELLERIGIEAARASAFRQRLQTLSTVTRVNLRQAFPRQPRPGRRHAASDGARRARPLSCNQRPRSAGATGRSAPIVSFRDRQTLATTPGAIDMNPQTFFDHFERLTDAPNAVARLRELILHLAVQGNLIEQDSTDEPSARLLERIETERRRLVKEKKIRGAKPLPFVSEDEKPFEIPSTWQWVRLGEIGDWGAGATPDRKNPDYYGGSTFWFKSGELNDGYISESEETITNLALQKCSLRLNQPGDVLIAMYGATIGKVAILEKTATTNQAVCACTCFASVYNRFLFLLLKAYKTRFTNQGAGGAQPNISREKIIHTVAPLPPFEEQKRIVAKVDELMRLCDELERVQAERREARQRLNRATLDGLLAARDAAEFQARWQTITDNFPTLTAAPDQIGKLRQTVLQLAVQGKLTRQDPQDEPAPALLQRIRAERERLIKEKKLKRADPLPPVNFNETPFALPSGWTWTYLDAISNAIHYGYTASANPILTDVRLLRITDIQNGKVDWDSVPGCEIDKETLPGFELNDSDILIARTGGTIGKSYLVEDLVVRAVFASYLIRVVPNSVSYPKLFFESDLYWTQLRAKSVDAIFQSSPQPSEEVETKEPLAKVTLYIRPDQVVSIEDIQLAVRKSTGKRPDKSALMQEALDMLIDKYSKTA